MVIQPTREEAVFDIGGTQSHFDQSPQSSHDARVGFDPSGFITKVNDSFTRITGYEPAEIQGCNVRVLSAGLMQPEFYLELFRHLMAEGRWQGRITYRRRNGEVFSARTEITSLRDTHDPLGEYIGAFTTMADKQ